MIILKTISANKSFFLILLSWAILGKLGGAVIGTLVTCGSLLYFWNNGKFIEALIGLFYLLTLSDSFYFTFAATAKSVYMPLICFLIIWDNFHLIVKVSAFYKTMAVFFIYSLSLLFLSETIFKSFQKNISYILLFTCIPALFWGIFQNKKEGDRFLNLFFSLTTLLLGIGLVMYVFNVSIAFRGRFSGVLGNPNGLGTYCLLLFYFFVVSKEYKKSFFRGWERYVFYVFLFVSFLLSGSRASLLSFFIGIILFIFRLRWISALLLTVFLIIASSFLYDLLIDVIGELGFTEYARVGTIDVAGGRIHGWRFAWEEIQKNFLFGKGWAYDEFFFYREDVQNELNLLNHQGGVHNSLLGIWMNTGFFGVVLFCTGWIINFMRASLYSRWAIPLIFSVLVSTTFEPWLIASLNPFTIQLLFILTFQFYFLKVNNELVRT